MKEYICMQVGTHKNIGKTIEEYQMKGWRLHTYSTAGAGFGEIRHYLLFERESSS